jgi:hypothetical protein
VITAGRPGIVCPGHFGAGYLTVVTLTDWQAAAYMGVDRREIWMTEYVGAAGVCLACVLAGLPPTR